MVGSLRPEIRFAKKLLTDRQTDRRTDGLRDWGTEGRTDWGTDGLRDGRTDAGSHCSSDLLQHLCSSGLTLVRLVRVLYWRRCTKLVTFLHLGHFALVLPAMLLRLVWYLVFKCFILRISCHDVTNICQLNLVSSFVTFFHWNFCLVVNHWPPKTGNVDSADMRKQRTPQ